MWWFKLVVHWSKRDYIGFSLFIWVLILGILAVSRLVQNRPLDLPFMAVLTFAVIPVELLIIILFQKYSSNVDEILDYPSLLQGDFVNDQLLKSGKILVFFLCRVVSFLPQCFSSLSLS
jgi:hypothetical protein